MLDCLSMYMGGKENRNGTQWREIVEEGAGIQKKKEIMKKKTTKQQQRKKAGRETVQMRLRTKSRKI